MQYNLGALSVLKQLTTFVVALLLTARDVFYLRVLRLCFSEKAAFAVEGKREGESKQRGERGRGEPREPPREYRSTPGLDTLGPVVGGGKTTKRAPSLEPKQSDG